MSFYCCTHHRHYPASEWCEECAADDTVRCDICEDTKPEAECKQVGEIWVCWHCQCDHETGEPTDDPTRWWENGEKE